MTKRAGLVVLLVLAAIVAGLLISTLLLVGVDPHWVFLPGHFVKARLHVSNRAGVLTTFVVWWAIVVAIWLGVRARYNR